eukprot:CAMPEP_0119361830 /NCGR_PEP_ID=MMETSP1334-20130426/9053_1 /TAXON_ID=127549 /ORGANISM="Calcidiscus leptoporus, Strain RCC1130" /LENGTH=306 /DNA_ID=CAMNT_0007376941 /DNA_START=216 /DNA_END=1132 /DNA_ORIENTATION=-
MPSRDGHEHAPRPSASTHGTSRTHAATAAAARPHQLAVRCDADDACGERSGKPTAQARTRVAVRLLALTTTVGSVLLLAGTLANTSLPALAAHLGRSGAPRSLPAIGGDRDLDIGGALRRRLGDSDEKIEKMEKKAKKAKKSKEGKMGKEGKEGKMGKEGKAVGKPVDGKSKGAKGKGLGLGKGKKSAGQGQEEQAAALANEDGVSALGRRLDGDGDDDDDDGDDDDDDDGDDDDDYNHEDYHKAVNKAGERTMPPEAAASLTAATAITASATTGSAAATPAASATTIASAATTTPAAAAAAAAAA